MVTHKTRWTISSAEKLLTTSCSRLPKVRAYCLDALSGKAPVGRLVFLAVDRFLNDLRDAKQRDLTFDQDAAARVLLFFHRFLCLAEGQYEGKPFILQPWQQFGLANVFGWKGLDGFRRFRTAYFEIGKGNGKSPMAAGVLLYGLVADGENAAEIYSAAVTKDQAKILFRDAENMREASPMLKARIQKHVNNLSVQKTQSYARPISSEHRGLDGKRPHIVLIDEVHEHPTPIVVDKMRAGTKGRRQALIFEITNSGYDRETVCYYHHDYSRKVLEGNLQDDSWFAFVCGLDACPECQKQGREQPACQECDDWRDEAVWIKANPNLGVSIQPKYLYEQVREATAMPAKENIVKRLNFCLWTQQDTRAIGGDAWKACAGVPEMVSPKDVRQEWEQELAGQPCYAGLDLASTQDIAAFVLDFPKTRANPVERFLPFFFVPEKMLVQRSHHDRVPYDAWARDGFLITTPGDVIDYTFIEKTVLNCAEKYQILEVGFDRWNAAQIIQRLIDQGLVMVQFGQGYESMNAPTKEFLKMVSGAEFAHGNNPILTWMADNLVVRADPAGNLKPVKPDNPNSTKKIDGIVAALMAKGRAMQHPDVEAGGVEVWNL